VRIAMVGPYPLPGRPPTGGIEAVATALTDGLREAGATVELITCTPSVSREERVERDGMPMWLIPYGSIADRRLPYVHEHRAVARRLRAIAPDVVHVQGQNVLGPAALSAGLPTVVTLHGILYREQHIGDATASALSRLKARARNGLNARFEATTLKRARHLVIISPYVLDAVRHMTSAEAHMIPNPIDDDFYALERRPVDDRVLFVGVVGARKNVLVLVRSFAEVLERRPDATLHLVGRPADRSYIDEVRSTIDALGMGGSVRYLGIVSDEELRTQYSEASLLALPSKEESSPMAIQQAMAMGLPIVASRAGGIPFLVDDGETGLLATPDDEHDLADRLVQALGDDALRRRMSDACRVRAERFRGEAVAQATLALYATAAGRRPAMAAAG
jgi:glycosyltransferase involved in cell wall biosynthesis